MRLDKNTETVMELFSEPLLVVRQGKLMRMNSAAQKMFPNARPRQRVSELIPEQILEHTGESFSAAFERRGRSYCVTGRDCGELRFLILQPSLFGAQSPGILTDGVMTSLLSTLFQIGLTIDRIGTLAEGELGGAANRYIAMLRHGYYSLWRQLSNLEILRRLRNHTLVNLPRQVDLIELCASVCAEADDLTKDRYTRIRFSSELRELFAWADGELLERAVLNLLSNSLQHTPQSGEILVSAWRSGEEAAISVKDSGEGIPQEVLQDIFSERPKPERGLESAAAAGLGLPVCRGIVQLYGGTLLIESRVGFGTTACIRLPLRSASEVQNGIIRESSGVDLFLAEFASILGEEYYTEKYMD